VTGDLSDRGRIQELPKTVAAASSCVIRNVPHLEGASTVQ